MTAAPTSTLALMLDLTRRLAEDYREIPLTVVGRCVQVATSAARMAAADADAAVRAVESLARADLDTVAGHPSAPAADATAALAS